ncbi:MAG: NnrU family protein [Polyangiaceae bacterium]
MLGVAFGVVSYLLFLVVFVGFALFSDGLVTFTDQQISSGETYRAVLVDVGLMLLFGLQHSVMARRGFKERLTRLVPERLERSTYVLISSFALGVLIWQWRPIDGEVWAIQHPVLTPALWGLNAIGWLGVPVSSLLIDHLELFGLKQAWSGFQRASFASRGFVAPYLYRYVRHPMMSALMVGLWVTPSMTAGHVLLAVGMSIYIFIGVYFEERSLVAQLGVDYLKYMETTPRFVPVPFSKSSEEPPVSQSGLR